MRHAIYPVIFIFALSVLQSNRALAAQWVDVETRADGSSMSYDADSLQRSGSTAVMWHEIVWKVPVDCDSSGCTKSARMRYQYDCAHSLIARIEYLGLDASGIERSRKTYRAYFAPIKADDRASRALYNAACSTTGRRQG